MLYNVFFFLIYAIEFIGLFFIVYNSTISLLGMFKPSKEKHEEEHPLETRFAILICAHNEEQVVGQLVQNLDSLDYPRNLYDIYVIAD
ncbi:glycosyltransferase family 2 protein, partial [Paenibacillus larvae]|nr:glycosyl transferase [Paenibacillus larvae]MDT2182764.1 glycosyl transferase [Paenibacillus larvae]MDT2198947.1 glycosyl transferase [Paenibacillus larvae]MDT2208391.1 glycosyl transferase [Paenibacillus larvae]